MTAPTSRATSSELPQPANRTTGASASRAKSLLMIYEALAAALLDERHHLEHREIHRDDDRPDHRADADHQHRLDDRGERLDARVDLVLVEIGDLAEHLLELAGLLADLHHLAEHRREHRIAGERLTDRDALVHALAHVGERLLDHEVAGRRARDLERADDVDAGGDERRQRPRHAGQRDLPDDVTYLHRDPE